MRLMAETGMRAGELTGLLVDDVDLIRGLVTVRRGKGGKGRLAPFGRRPRARSTAICAPGARTVSLKRRRCGSVTAASRWSITGCTRR